MCPKCGWRIRATELTGIPVLHADYSDPDVCAVGDDFYMTASSFGCTPGLPVLHSKDLVNWRNRQLCLKELEPKEFYNSARHGKGVWAPSIRYHKGEFYIYWGDPDFGIFMVKTKDPAGEWEKPVLVKAGKGMIDLHRCGMRTDMCIWYMPGPAAVQDEQYCGGMRNECGRHAGYQQSGTCV